MTLPAPIVPVVRRATPDDIGALLAAIAALAAHHGEEATATAEALRQDLFGPAPWATALVADREGCLVGYALLVRLYRAQFAARVMELHHLHVAAEARGGGIGTALLRAAAEVAEASGCVQLVLGVRADNLAALPFYRERGFEALATGSVRFGLRLVPARPIA